MRTRHITRVLLPLLLLAGCKGGEDRYFAGDTAPVAANEQGTSAPQLSRSVTPGAPAVIAGDQQAAALEITAADTTAAPQPARPGGGDSSAPAAPVIPTMIIRTGRATVRVDSLELAVARVKQLAARLGGYVANSSESTGSQNVRQASLELKLPANHWDQALSGLRPLGKLEAQQATSEDVGEEFTDVTARVGNSRRLEARLLDLLGTRTGKLDDVLAVERELARVREEIDRYEGRLRYLRSRVALSTLTVELHEPYPTLGPGSNPIVDAFRTAWRNFVGFVAGFIASLGWLVPLLAIGWVVFWVVRRIRARRPATAPRKPAGPPPPAPPA